MTRRLAWKLTLVVAASWFTGCGMREQAIQFSDNLQQMKQVADSAEYDDAVQLASHQIVSNDINHGPRLLTDERPPDYWVLTPEEAVQIALTNSTVLRDLGGTAVTSPNNLQTIHNPAIVKTDPINGVDAALSFFDAQFSTSLFAEKNDRAFNNEFLGGGINEFKQDLIIADATITKQSAVGTSFTFRKNVEYNANNSPRNLFGHAWTVFLEGEIRQPLLQGAGERFNRIAGPQAVPGQINGVRIARINTDVSLTDFELAMRNLISNVENAYWDLYVAYRELETRKQARARALETWRQFDARKRQQIGAPSDEPQAREQFFRFVEEVQDALNGRLVDGTRNGNGSLGGTFRGTSGLLVAERRLRLIIGIPINDHRLIRPAYDPAVVNVKFNWNEIVAEALSRRSELRRQRLQVRRRELELLASRNFLMPRFDAVFRYRFRGFGRSLWDANSKSTPADPFNNAVEELLHGDQQEGAIGFEYQFPIGFRQAHAGVRNAQLNLAREKSLLAEAERFVVHGLSNAYGELTRSFNVVQTAYNRRHAAQEYFDILMARLRGDEPVDANQLLDSQRRLADAESRYFDSLINYVLAVKNVHFEKGSLLDYNEVYMEDSPRIPIDSEQPSREWLRGNPLNYVLERVPTNVTLGTSGNAPSTPQPNHGTQSRPRRLPQTNATAASQSNRSATPQTVRTATRPRRLPSPGSPAPVEASRPNTTATAPPQAARGSLDLTAPESNSNANSNSNSAAKPRTALSILPFSPRDVPELQDTVSADKTSGSSKSPAEAPRVASKPKPAVPTPAAKPTLNDKNAGSAQTTEPAAKPLVKPVPIPVPAAKAVAKPAAKPVVKPASKPLVVPAPALKPAAIPADRNAKSSKPRGAVIQPAKPSFPVASKPVASKPATSKPVAGKSALPSAGIPDSGSASSKLSDSTPIARRQSTPLISKPAPAMVIPAAKPKPSPTQQAPTQQATSRPNWNLPKLSSGQPTTPLRLPTPTSTTPSSNSVGDDDMQMAPTYAARQPAAEPNNRSSAFQPPRQPQDDKIRQPASMVGRGGSFEGGNSTPGRSQPVVQPALRFQPMTQPVPSLSQSPATRRNGSNDSRSSAQLSSPFAPPAQAASQPTTPRGPGERDRNVAPTSFAPPPVPSAGNQNSPERQRFFQMLFGQPKAPGSGDSTDSDSTDTHSPSTPPSQKADPDMDSDLLQQPMSIQGKASQDGMFRLPSAGN